MTWQRRVELDLANFRAVFEDLVGAGDVDGCQALIAGLWPTMLGDSSLVHTDWAPAAVASLRSTSGRRQPRRAPPRRGAR